MRRRNRKKRKNEGFLFPVPFAGLVIVGVTLGLGYVWLGSRCQSLGQELKALEFRRDELQRQFQQERYKWTRMKAPANLDKELARRGLTMRWPSSRQIVRLESAEMLADPWDRDPGTRYARVDWVKRHE